MRHAPPEVQAEWARRVVAEYRSAAAAQELALWLLQMGASVDLVRAAQCIACDELDHAERSAAVLAAAGGAAPGPVDRATLALARTGGPLEHDVLLVGVELYCVRETLAVPLFRRMLDGATVPVVRSTLTRILADEARHRRFGWALLDAFLARADAPSLRSALGRALPGIARRVEAAYGGTGGGEGEGSGGEGGGHGGGEVGEDSESDVARAWGLLPRAAYDDELRRTTRRWYRPRFAAAGLDW